MSDSMRNGIPTRILGQTGERVTILGVGGYHIGMNSRELGVEIIRTAIDEGINFLDNAWCYHAGKSEEIMGVALQNGYRDKVFLMTKNHGRDAATFRHQLAESLTRLKTDHIDLLQFHEVIHEGIPNRIFAEGAIEAALEAREQGKIRFIGFTGHRWPHLLGQMLAHDFAWDTAQLPLNLLDYHYRSFAKNVLPTLVARGMGVVAMKGLGGTPGRLLDTGVSAAEAIGYTLSLPVSVLVSGMDSVERLRQNLAIARTWQQQSEAEMQRLQQAVAPVAHDGRLESYKTR